VCPDCGAVVLAIRAHNRHHWRVDPRGELSVGVEVYITTWGEGNGNGTTVHMKATVTGFDESVVRVDRKGKTYYFDYDGVFPADPEYGFDPLYRPSIRR